MMPLILTYILDSAFHCMHMYVLIVFDLYAYPIVYSSDHKWYIALNKKYTLFVCLLLLGRFVTSMVSNITQLSRGHLKVFTHPENQHASPVFPCGNI